MSLRGKSKRFVVQQHKARSEHWDLRLQMDDTMKSWVLPKGPSINPKVKRLAIETTDHSLEYADFEGIIAPKLYGTGKVLLWDKGSYKLLEGSLEKGILKFILKGKKLKGGFVLVKTKRGWLLIKEKDGFARKVDIIKEKPKSVKSGKTIKDITEKEGLITKKEELGF